MKNQKKRVLIVGAGLSGLALFHALNKHIYDVDIVEKNKAFKRLGYAINLMPNGVKALTTLGFTNGQIKKLGREVQENQVRNEKGEVKTVTDFRPFIKKFGNYMVVTRERLYKLLESSISKNAVRFGVYPVSFKKKGISTLVKFSDGTEVNYDLVVGADGVNSFVRTKLFTTSKPVGLAHTFIWTWIPRKAGPFPKQTGIMGDQGNGLGFFDSGERDRICVFFFFQSKKFPKHMSYGALPQYIKRELKSFGEPTSAILKVLPKGSDMYFHHDHELNIKKWNKGNMLLIGDAAHARSVFTGAGSALALEDAVILSRLLNKKGDFKEAINTFYTKQNKRIKIMVLKNLFGKKLKPTLNSFLSSSSLYKKDL